MVKDNHQHFLEACRGVGELEDQVALLRNYVNGLTALVASLRSSRPTARQVGGRAVPCLAVNASQAVRCWLLNTSSWVRYFQSGIWCRMKGMLPT